MINPLVVITVVLALGIMTGNFMHFPVFYFLIAAVIVFFCSLIYARHERFGDVVLLCLVFFLGCVLLKESRVLPNNHIVKIYSSIYGNAVKLSGRVAREPEVFRAKTSCVFSISEAQVRGKKISVQGDVIINIPGNKDIQFGDTLQVTGKLYRPFAGSENKNNYREYLRRRNIWYVMRVPVPSCVFLVKRAFSLQQCGLRIKHIMSAALHSYLTPVSGAVVDAMVFGEKKDIPVFLYNSMVKTGIVHILVVSGFNVGIVASGVLLILKIIRIPKKTRLFLSICLVIVYCFITGFSPPVLRATIMAIVFISAYFFRAEPDIFSACALAALIILVTCPGQLFDVSFQLSFASVIALITLFPILQKISSAGKIKNRIMRFLTESMLVSFSAWMGTIGFIVYYFGIICPVTVISNIFIVPLAAWITLCGFSLIFMSAVSPFLAVYCAAVTEAVVRVLFIINSWIVKFPGAYFYLK